MRTVDRPGRAPISTGIVVACFAGAVTLLAWSSAGAVQIRPVPKTWVEMRDGVRIDHLSPSDKVSSPDLPIDTSFGIGSSVGAGAASTNLFPNTITANVVADPGDASDATLCVAYSLSETVSGAVTAATGSYAVGIGGTTGFTANAAAPPASVSIPTPLTLIVTPAIGPVRTILSVDPLMLASTGALQSSSLSRAGKFKVAAGDVITLDAELGAAIRAELPSGATNADASLKFRATNCASPPIPTLSGIATVFMALLLLAAAAGRFRRIAPRANRRPGR